MINSRKLEDLLPVVRTKAEKFLEECKAAGIQIIVTSTLRDNECQEQLYCQGRTTPGAIVTNAKAGESMHNYGVAFDIVPLRNGKCVWGTKGEDLDLWKKVGAIGVQCGLEWAGNWNSFKEFPHFQYTGGLSLIELKAGFMPS